jgi:hypothetical protein
MNPALALLLYPAGLAAFALWAVLCGLANVDPS